MGHAPDPPASQGRLRDTGRLPSPDPANDLFELSGVEVDRGGRRILRVDQLRVAAAGVTAITGPSGSGKSTLLRLLNRLDIPSRGTVRFRGRPLDDLDPLQLRRRVGMVFQQPALFGGTVRDNLEVAAPGAGGEAFAAALQRAGLDVELLDRPASVLSGGEAQRACIARTLSTGPEALLFDEPTSALDGRATQRIEILAAELARDGIPLVWITHDLAQLFRIADHILVVDGGQVTYNGAPAGLSRDDPLLTRLAGGAS